MYDFEPLYKLLSDEYRIVVVEKAGYGYSKVSNSPRDIDTMLEETRQALALAGETGPFVLFPHSMSGLEALYWAQLYPNEVKAIVGLDMATPLYYENVNISKFTHTALSIATWMGIHRLPLVYSIDQVTLDDEEYMQKNF